MKKFISFGIGIALLVSPVIASAQTVSADNSSIIAILEQLVATLTQELQQLIAARSGATQNNPALLTATPTNGSAPLTVELHINPSVASANSIDFGDEKTSVETLGNGSGNSCGDPNESECAHVYTTPGTYTAHIYDVKSEILASVTVNVTATSALPLSATPTSGSAPLTVTFSNLPITAAEENLNFGDGKATSNGATGNWPSGGIVHTYTNPGTYTATLVGEMSQGQMGSATITVTGSSTSQSSVAPTCTLTPSGYTLSPYTVVPGQIYVKMGSNVTLTWTSQNATSGTWSSGDKAGVSGSITFNNLTQSTNNYSINFTGSGGSVTCSTTINVDLKG